MLMNLQQDNHNMKLGLEKMQNMLIKLMQLMKPQRLFNIYKQVLPSLNLKVDLKRSKLN